MRLPDPRLPTCSPPQPPQLFRATPRLVWAAAVSVCMRHAATRCEAIAEEHNARCEPDLYSPEGELMNQAPGIEYDVEYMQD